MIYSLLRIVNSSKDIFVYLEPIAWHVFRN
jgi:hypothetical protein